MFIDCLQLYNQVLKIGDEVHAVFSLFASTKLLPSNDEVTESTWIFSSTHSSFWRYCLKTNYPYRFLNDIIVLQNATYLPHPLVNMMRYELLQTLYYEGNCKEEASVFQQLTKARHRTSTVWTSVSNGHATPTTSVHTNSGKPDWTSHCEHNF